MYENIKKAFVDKTEIGYTVTIVDLNGEEFGIYDFEFDEKEEAFDVANELNISCYIEGAEDLAAA